MKPIFGFVQNSCLGLKTNVFSVITYDGDLTLDPGHQVILNANAVREAFINEWNDLPNEIRMSNSMCKIADLIRQL